MKLPIYHGLPHALLIEQDEGDETLQCTFVYFEKKIKKVTDQEVRSIQYLEQAGMRVRIGLAGDIGDLVTLREYGNPLRESLPDMTLAPSTINNYKTRYKSLVLQANLEEDPTRKNILTEQAEKLRQILGIKRRLTRSDITPSSSPYSKDTQEARIRELLAAYHGGGSQKDSDKILDELASGLEAPTTTPKDPKDPKDNKGDM